MVHRLAVGGCSALFDGGRNCEDAPTGTQYGWLNFHIAAWTVAREDLTRESRTSAGAGKLRTHDSPVCPRSVCGSGALFGI